MIGLGNNSAHNLLRYKTNDLKALLFFKGFLVASGNIVYSTVCIPHSFHRENQLFPLYATMKVKLYSIKMPTAIPALVGEAGALWTGVAAHLGAPHFKKSYSYGSYVKLVL